MSRPVVTLKIATSLDGRIALANGVSQWITSADSRARGHELRARHDAILTGIGTVLADDPLLTARTVPLPERQPVRIVADSLGRTPPSSRLVQSAGQGRVIIATAGAYPDALLREGIEVWRCGLGARTDPAKLMEHAAADGLNSILLESGGTLAAGFLKADLVDVIVWFRAPILIGSEGLPAFGALGLTALSAASRWRPHAAERIGDDVLETYVRT